MEMKCLIDDEFRDLIPPLRPEEYEQLQVSLNKEGCRDAIVTWNGTILDGHNRYEICTMLKLPYRTIEIDLPDREAAKDWIDRNQLGRRNLTPDMFKVLLGRRYNRQKKKEGRPEKRLQNEDVTPERTAEKLAKEHGVSKSTVERAGKFAERVESDPELAQAIKERRPVKQQAEPKVEREPEPTIEEPTPTGVGMQYANKAIQCLKRIPKDDPLRNRGFRLVSDFIKYNK